MQSGREGLEVAELEFPAALEHDGVAPMPPSAPELAPPPSRTLEPELEPGLEPKAAASVSVQRQTGDAASGAADVGGVEDSKAEDGQAEEPALLDPAVAALCVPLSDADPCGPDLDLESDAEYLNFLARAEGILPSSFFSVDDGKPFDRSSVDLTGQIDAVGPLWNRSRDLRLLVMRARLLILNRDLGGFAVTIAAIAEWLDRFWDDVHPRAADGSDGALAAALGALDLPTVVFPLQYAPLCEGRRIGAVTYRGWMIAAGEVKPRPGEQKYPSEALVEAIADADPAALATTRKHVAMLKTSLGRIRNAFLMRGSSSGLENLPDLADKIRDFVDPRAAVNEEAAAETPEDDTAAGTTKERTGARAAGSAPASLADAQQALAAIADYYSRSEPSSPTLPLVRQAHQLIGKSFFEVMSILVPTQMDKAAFQIGADQFFELPIGKLSKLSEVTPVLARQASPDGGGQTTGSAQSAGGGSLQYSVESRTQAITLLEQIQRFFRHSEPSSPVPMLCDRARALAERDFMSVLRDVLPKAALKNFGAEK